MKWTWHIKEKLRLPRDLMFARWKGLGFNTSWRFLGLPHIHQCRPGSIRIGDRFTACSKVSQNDLGVNQPVVLRTVRPDARIEIGNHVGVSGCSICAMGSIRIGNEVLVGTGAIICDSDMHPMQPNIRRDALRTKWKPVVIEDDAFIGARAIILKGVRVGRSAVVGAGAVVTKDVPDYAIVAGNPAKLVGDCRDFPISDGDF